jgi:hypothetical protein
MPATRQTGPITADIDAGERPPSGADLWHRLCQSASADDRLLFDVATYLRERRLAPLVVLWLESCRPLTFLGSQALHAATPLVDVFYPRLPLARLAALLENRCNLDLFLDYLAASDTGETSARRTRARDEPGGAA